MALNKESLRNIEGSLPGKEVLVHVTNDPALPDMSSFYYGYSLTDNGFKLETSFDRKPVRGSKETPTIFAGVKVTKKGGSITWSSKFMNSKHHFFGIECKQASPTEPILGTYYSRTGADVQTVQFTVENGEIEVQSDINMSPDRISKTAEIISTTFEYQATMLVTMRNRAENITSSDVDTTSI